jgi:hypothetical protein
MKKLFNFRLPITLVDIIRKIAYKENRSLTAQIETILSEYAKDKNDDQN